MKYWYMLQPWKHYYMASYKAITHCMIPFIWTRNCEYTKIYWIIHFTCTQNTSCQMPSWMKHKLESRLLGETSVTSDMTPPLWQKSEEELKSLLMKAKEESEKDGLKLNMQKPKIMACGPTTSWQIDREEMETVADFIFLGSKITANTDSCHEIKVCLPLGRKTMTNVAY